MTLAASKGKWIPGTRDTPSSGSSYRCDSCDRRFTKKAYLDKHLTTELHIKRAGRSQATIPNDIGHFDQVQVLDCEPRRSSRIGKGAKYQACRQGGTLLESFNKDPTATGRTWVEQDSVGVAVVNSSNDVKRSYTCCPTCYSKVDKKQMGKHLISHFHCQKTRSSRLAKLEMSLILDHIHDIVVQSPYQCATCKFYFMQKEQLLAHVRDRHLASVSIENSHNSLKWNCSACSRTKFSPDGQKLLEHLQSSSHRIVESAIAKSIPIIIRQISAHSCPVSECNKLFILNRELISHVRTNHGSELINFPNDFSPFQHSLAFSGDVNSSMVQDVSDEPASETSNHFEIASKGMHPLHKNVSPEWEPQVKRKMTKKKRTPTSSSLKLAVNSPSDHQYASSRFAQHNFEKQKRIRGRLSCQTCNYSTHQMSHFTRHLKTHDGASRTKDFHCTDCSSSFFEKSALMCHLKIHTGKTVKCPVPSCTFTSRNNSELKSHSVVHNASGSYPCDLCKYSTKSKRHLVRHQLRVHQVNSSKKPPKTPHETVQNLFKCTECKFQTNTANGLKRHFLQHTEETPYRCPHCNFQSRNIENLRTHVLKRQLHAGKFLYCCSICAKTERLQKKSPFATNKFLDFRKHVEQEHVDDARAKSQKGVFIIAGIQPDPDDASNEPSIQTVESDNETDNNDPLGEGDETDSPNALSPATSSTEVQENLSNVVQEVIQLEEDVVFDIDAPIFISLDAYPEEMISNYDVSQPPNVKLEKPT